MAHYNKGFPAATRKSEVTGWGCVCVFGECEYDGGYYGGGGD
jgi:hypothetical protein